MTGTENSRHFLNQSDSKLKSIRDLITRLYRDLGSLLVFLMSSHWLFSPLLIGRANFLNQSQGETKEQLHYFLLSARQNHGFKKHDISLLDIIHPYHLLFSI